MLSTHIAYKEGRNKIIGDEEERLEEERGKYQKDVRQ